MDLSRLQLLNDYLFIGIAVALTYLVAVLVITRLIQVIKQYRGRRRGDGRPGEMVHQALKVTGRLWDRYRTATLLFAISLLLLLNFGRMDIFAQRSDLLMCSPPG